MTINKIINILKVETKDYPSTLIDLIIKEYRKKPFKILISAILSPRVRDITTIQVCRNLFEIAKNPKQLFEIPITKLEKIIFKTVFYKNKAKALHECCRILLEKFNGKVPKTQNELLTLPGVGRKVANLVLGMAFEIPEICVDTHVQRISNRLGIVKTKKPEETEIALQKILSKKDWIDWNNLLVKWGQNICTPTSPWCSKCAIKNYCKQVDVTKSR